MNLVVQENKKILKEKIMSGLTPNSEPKRDAGVWTLWMSDAVGGGKLAHLGQNNN